MITAQSRTIRGIYTDPAGTVFLWEHARHDADEHLTVRPDRQGTQPSKLHLSGEDEGRWSGSQVPETRLAGERIAHQLGLLEGGRRRFAVVEAKDDEGWRKSLVVDLELGQAWCEVDGEGRAQAVAAALNEVAVDVSAELDSQPF